MSELSRLERLAQELIVRVRDDEPRSNARWLTANTDELDRWALLFLLAAAVPDDRSWSQLTRWTDPDSPQAQAERRRQLDMALRKQRAA